MWKIIQLCITLCPQIADCKTSNVSPLVGIWSTSSSPRLWTSSPLYTSTSLSRVPAGSLGARHSSWPSSFSFGVSCGQCTSVIPPARLLDSFEAREAFLLAAFILRAPQIGRFVLRSPKPQTSVFWRDRWLLVLPRAVVKDKTFRSFGSHFESSGVV